MRLTPLFVLLFLVLAAYGQQERVAILNTVDDRDSISVSDLTHLTNRLRETAVKVLPKQRYGVMTTESIVAFLGSQENARRVCNESSCLAEVGRKVSADYVAQARVGRFGNQLSINFQLYNVITGNLVDSFTGDSKDIFGLRDIIDENAPVLFKQMIDESKPQKNEPPTTIATLPTPVTEPEQALKFSLDWLTESALAPKPKLMSSVAQALSGNNLPRGCTEDFTNILGKDGFDMSKFMKDVPQDVAKVRLQLKSPLFGKPKDSDKTNSGLTVGCIKALPESPAEITSLLKDISLSMGLDLAVEAVASVADNHIPANVATKSGSDGTSLGWRTWTRIFTFTAAAALGTVAIMKYSDATHYADKASAERKKMIKNGESDPEYPEWEEAYNFYQKKFDEKNDSKINFGIGAGVFAVGGTITFIF